MEIFFKNNLKFLRKSKKLTLLDLGSALNISKSALSDYENGKSAPSLAVLEAIGNLPKVEEKRVMIFPEFSDYNFSKIFFRNMFMWAAIAVISIVFLNKLFPLLKGDAHRYKKAWKELYKSKLQKEKFTMDSVLFYGKGVELDSIGKK